MIPSVLVIQKGIHCDPIGNPSLSFVPLDVLIIYARNQVGLKLETYEYQIQEFKLLISTIQLNLS